MRRLSPVLLALLVAGFVAGCEPSPSTPLAADKPLPDASKLSKEETDRLMKINQDAGKRP